MEKSVDSMPLMYPIEVVESKSISAFEMIDVEHSGYDEIDVLSPKHRKGIEPTDA